MSGLLLLRRRLYGTSYLHLGSLRTALFNYLLAEATGGQFIIRLEDTDQKRFVDDAESRLYQDLKWAGLTWAEGPDKGGPLGPYKQSQRLELYRLHADTLLRKGQAFRCFCTKDDLEFDLKRAIASGATAHYPGTCMGISPSESDRRAANGEPHVVRFKSSETPVLATDLVYGAYKKGEREDNFIIMKSDGYPTYHFANVVDDHFMKITHVIRGAEWLISTPKHVELYNAFGWDPPSFAHVGLLVDQQRQKLSKRDIDNIGISAYKESETIPLALLNFSVLLGWDPNLQKNTHLIKKGAWTLKDMKENFSLKFTRGDIVVNLSKLKYFQTRIIRDLISGDIVDPPALQKHVLDPILMALRQLSYEHEKFMQNREAVHTRTRDFFDVNVGHSKITFEEITRDYVRGVVEAFKGQVVDHDKFVTQAFFAFTISKHALRHSFDDLQDSLRRIMIKTNKQTPEHANIARVLFIFRTRLAAISDSNWNMETVEIEVKNLVDSISCYDTKTQQLLDKSPGWKFLRWALFNGATALRVVPMMITMGRAETLKRLKNARQVAMLQEEKLLDRIKQEGKTIIMKRLDVDSWEESKNAEGAGENERGGIVARNVMVKQDFEHDPSRQQEDNIKKSDYSSGPESHPRPVLVQKTPLPPDDNLTGPDPVGAVLPTRQHASTPPKSEKSESKEVTEAPQLVHRDALSNGTRGEYEPAVWERLRHVSAPTSPKSEKRELKDVAKAPQLLSQDEFKNGTRHLHFDHRGEYEPAVWERLRQLLESRGQDPKLQTTQSHSKQDRQAPYSQIEPGRNSLGDGISLEGHGPFMLGRSAPPNVASHIEHLRAITVSKKDRQANSGIAVPKRQSIGVVDFQKDRGPFMPDKPAIPNLASHIEHLRALTLSKKAEKAKRQESGVAVPNWQSIGVVDSQKERGPFMPGNLPIPDLKNHVEQLRALDDIKKARHSEKWEDRIASAGRFKARLARQVVGLTPPLSSASEELPESRKPPSEDSGKIERGLGPMYLGPPAHELVDLRRPVGDHGIREKVRELITAQEWVVKQEVREEDNVSMQQPESRIAELWKIASGKKSWSEPGVKGRDGKKDGRPPSFPEGQWL